MNVNISEAIKHINRAGTFGENVATMQQLYGLTKDDAEILVKGTLVAMAFIEACRDLKRKSLITKI